MNHKPLSGEPGFWKNNCFNCWIDFISASAHSRETPVGSHVDGMLLKITKSITLLQKSKITGRKGQHYPLKTMRLPQKISF